MKSKRNIMLTAAVLALAIGGLGWFGIFKAQPSNIKNCIDGNTSLTPAVTYFTDSVYKKTEQAIGGMPIEGFEPYMILQAYPNLVASDFECVQAEQGMYTVDGEIIFTSTAKKGKQTSAEKSITSAGMGTLLENISKRLSMPISSEAEVNALIKSLSNDPGSIPPRATLRGQYACLPQKNSAGPQTMECVLGLRSDGGIYYGLRMQLLESTETLSKLKTGDRIEVEGPLFKADQIQNISLKKYNIQGVVDVTSLRKI